MTRLEEKVLMDLGHHFHDRLRRLLDDSAQVAEAAGLDMGMFAQVLYTVLLAESSVSAVSSGLPEDNFVATAREAWRIAYEKTVKRARRRQ